MRVCMLSMAGLILIQARAIYLLLAYNKPSYEVSLALGLLFLVGLVGAMAALALDQEELVKSTSKQLLRVITSGICFGRQGEAAISAVELASLTADHQSGAGDAVGGGGGGGGFQMLPISDDEERGGDRGGEGRGDLESNAGGISSAAVAASSNRKVDSDVMAERDAALAYTGSLGTPEGDEYALVLQQVHHRFVDWLRLIFIVVGLLGRHR